MNEELIRDKIDTHERRINNHADRIDKLELKQAETNVKIENLCKNIAGQTKALWWLIGLLGTSLAGFFFYAIQQKLF